MKRYFLFDTETGGLHAKEVSLLSFFGLILDKNFKVLDDINLLIRPDDGRYRLDIDAMKVNKIDILKHHELAIPQTEAAKKLKEFLWRNVGYSNEKLIPTGHNIGRLDIPMGERLLGFDEWNRRFAHRTVDTGTIAQFLVLRGTLPETNNCSLGQLCEHYKIDYTGAHDAKRDVFMTLEVLKAMVKEGTIPQCSPPTLT